MAANENKITGEAKMQELGPEELQNVSGGSILGDIAGMADSLGHDIGDLVSDVVSGEEPAAGTLKQTDAASVPFLPNEGPGPEIGK
ncbi:hypothetical protein [Martelella sp. FOR1707]